MAILALTLSMEEIDGQSRLQDNNQEGRKIIPEEQSISYEKKDVRRWTCAIVSDAVLAAFLVSHSVQECEQLKY